MKHALLTAAFAATLALGAAAPAVVHADDALEAFGSPLSSTALGETHGMGTGAFNFAYSLSAFSPPPESGHCPLHTLPSYVAGTVSNVLKTGHDTVKNAINNIR